MDRLTHGLDDLRGLVRTLTGMRVELRDRAAVGEPKSKLATDFGFSRETVTPNLRAAP
ncbi:hypothetical protein [Nocardia fluminea]